MIAQNLYMSANFLINLERLAIEGSIYVKAFLTFKQKYVELFTKKILTNIHDFPFSTL